MESVIQRLAKKAAPPPAPAQPLTVLPVARKEHEHGASCGANCDCGNEAGCCD